MMYKKTILLILFLILISKFSFSQEKKKNKLDFYPTINVLMGNAIDEFHENFSKNTLWGFNVDGVISPFQEAKAWELGAQLEFYFTGSREDVWNGIEVKSQSSFIRLNFVNRIRPFKKGPVDPFLEFSYGLNTSITTTSYEIVDEATFFEQFLLKREDVVNTETVKDYYDVSQNFAIGIGMVIKNIAVLQVKYNYNPEISYIQKEDITVTNYSVRYDPSKSKIQMITISLGFSLENAKAD